MKAWRDRWALKIDYHLSNILSIYDVINDENLSLECSGKGDFQVISVFYFTRSSKALWTMQRGVFRKRPAALIPKKTFLNSSAKNPQHPINKDVKTLIESFSNLKFKFNAKFSFRKLICNLKQIKSIKKFPNENSSKTIN